MKHDKTLKRKRISKALKNIFYYPLTIVSAAMGYGKTTAVRTYLNKCMVQTAWVSLFGSGGSEAAFWNKLCAALERIYPEPVKKLRRLGFPVNTIQVEAVTNIIREMIGGKITALVIDDYHIITQNKRVSKFIEQIVNEKILNLHIVLISRTRPKFNYTNLISKGMCYYIDASVLAFDLQEIKEYFDLMCFNISEENIKKIYCYTKGWISGIYLILPNLKRGVPVTECTGINKLIEDNLFCNLDEKTKQTLLCISIFDYFTLKQAIVVLDNSEVPQIIGNLMEQNAFIEFDRHTGFYKLHNILLDFLRQKLEISNINISELCYRAGKWYMDHGEVISAFDYYRRSGRTEELSKQLYNMKKVEIGYLGFKLLYKIYEELPTKLYIKYPLPFLQFACSFILSGDETIAQEGVRIANEMKKYYINNTEVSSSLRNRILGEIEVIYMFIVFNDEKKMVEHANKAYELFDGDISGIILRENEFTFSVPNLLYAYYKEPGKLKEKLDCILKGFPLGAFDRCGAKCEYIALAEYADFILLMLYEISKRNEFDTCYLNRIIQFSGQYSKNLKNRQVNNKPFLTKRETEVLYLLSQGLTQRKMSEQLCISISGIKRYIESIYKKLDANNKMVAVKNAKKLKLL